MRLATAALIIAALLAAPATASHDDRLSKRDARAQAHRFIGPFVDMLDLNRTVIARMVPARDCRRVSRVTVRCRFNARLADGRTVRSAVKVHRQRDGLLGFRTGLDVLRDGI